MAYKEHHKIIDENNHIIKLIHEGVKMKQEGKIDQAQNLFMQAWNNSLDDHEKCIAAHFIALIAWHQNNFEDNLKWNVESLNRANKVPEDKVKSYYPSLYLNIGISYEGLGNYPEAEKYYKLALKRLPDLPTGKANKQYSKGVRDTIFERKNRLYQKIE